MEIVFKNTKSKYLEIFCLLDLDNIHETFKRFSSIKEPLEVKIFAVNESISSHQLSKLKNHFEKINIFNASLLAMKRSILKLKFKPKIVKVDGNKKPNINNLNIKSVVRGDQKIPEISAASILAKVSRDRLIRKMSKKFKAYLWDKNVGYGTRDHLSAIKKFGITKHHRKTFKPIHNILSPK